MAFQFGDWMINEYLAEGYLVLRGVVPPSLLGDLRTEAVKARDLATHFPTISGLCSPVGRHIRRFAFRP